MARSNMDSQMRPALLQVLADSSPCAVSDLLARPELEPWHGSRPIRNLLRKLKREGLVELRDDAVLLTEAGAFALTLSRIADLRLATKECLEAYPDYVGSSKVRESDSATAPLGAYFDSLVRVLRQLW